MRWKCVHISAMGTMRYLLVYRVERTLLPAFPLAIASSKVRRAPKCWMERRLESAMASSSPSPSPRGGEVDVAEEEAAAMGVLRRPLSSAIWDATKSFKESCCSGSTKEEEEEKRQY